jgi:hypothetical protein
VAEAKKELSEMTVISSRGDRLLLLIRLIGKSFCNTDLMLKF